MQRDKLARLGIWTVFTLISLLLLAVFIWHPKIHYGGDIIEYYGMTESLLRHGSLELTTDDQKAIEERLGTGYLKNPEYYLRGNDGNRYAVHFPLYSFIVAPVRGLLQVFGVDPYKTFRIANLLILTTISFFILKFFVKDPFHQLVYLMSVYLSPLIWFLIWPGPEVLSAVLILLSLFCFFAKKRWIAIAIAAVASYQSQPLAIIPLVYVIQHIIEQRHRDIVILFHRVKKEALAGLLVFIPNIYYLSIFSTPFSHGKLPGVGFQNATLLKFFELYFDPNIGLGFYMPVIFIIALFAIAKETFQSIRNLWVPVLLILLSLFYLTNNNWNSGTAGFGPIRYALPTIPFLLYFFVEHLSKKKMSYVVIGLLILSQLIILRMNGYLMPVLENDKRHTPIANALLAIAPSLYNPTPELFIERTLVREGGAWDTTIYKTNNHCTKAYVVNNNYQKLLEECGFIPEQYLPFVYSGTQEGYYVSYKL